TSLWAKAERTPVIGLTMPILTGVSPRAVRMNGDAICKAPTAAPARRTVRRAIRLDAEILFIRCLPDCRFFSCHRLMARSGAAFICLEVAPPSRGFGYPSGADTQRLDQPFEAGDHA